MHSISIPLAVDGKPGAKSPRKSIVSCTSFVTRGSVGFGGHRDDGWFRRVNAGAGVVLPGEVKFGGVTKGSRRDAREYIELGEFATELGTGSHWQNEGHLNLPSHFGK